MKKFFVTMGVMVASQIAASCLMEYVEYKKKEKAQQK